MSKSCELANVSHSNRHVVKLKFNVLVLQREQRNNAPTRCLDFSQAATRWQRTTHSRPGRAVCTSCKAEVVSVGFGWIYFSYIANPRIL